MTRVLAVIVNYRTAGLACNCLDAVARLPEVAAGELTVVVADNASGDGSAERLTVHVGERKYDWCRVVARPANDGFAAGNTAVIAPAVSGPAPPDAVWLLNPDTVPRPDALAPLVEALRNPRVGLVGSRLENPDGTPQRSAFRLPSMWSEFERAARTGPVSRLLANHLLAPPLPACASDVGWLSGASLLVRREVFTTAGHLDPGYFLYFEETDFCRRAGRAGWRCRYEPASQVVHLVGQATGVDGRNARPKPVPGYWFASRRRYFETAQGVVVARVADFGWLAGHAIWRLRRRLERRPDDDPPGLVRDFLQHTWGLK